MSSLDITETLAPKSDQLNADDLMAGPRTVTITGVSRGDPDQPVNVTTAEFGDERPFKPCKSMRRVMVAAWGVDAAAYVGRRMTIYREDKVRYGGAEVGGIRISHMSHLDKRLTLALTITRGKRAPFTVDPLLDEPTKKLAWITDEMATEFERDIAAANTVQELDAVGADLKAWDLGAHREKLSAAWGERRGALKGQAAEPVQEELK
jgi:hypothetical protein